MSPEEFWSSTPAELCIRMQSNAEAEKQRLIDGMFFAWHEALWSKYDSKHFPEWSKVQSMFDAPKRKKKQTPDQMLAFAKAITLACGGTVT